MNNTQKKIDILIINANILTMDNNFNHYKKNGFIIINNSKIVEIGTTDIDKISELKQNGYEIKKVINAKNNIVMPGLINTHTHAAMTMFRGFADDLPLMEWLENYIWPAEKKFITPENVFLGTELAIIEMIKSGTTTFNDMYFFEDEVAKASKKIGMRAIVGEGMLDIPVSFSKTKEKYHVELIEKYLNDDLITPSVVTHSPYTCSEDLLTYAKGLSDKYQIPMHIHISESEFEFNKFNTEKKSTPVEYLDKINFLNERTIAVHSVILSDNDIKIYKKNRVGVSHNIKSNLKLANGISPVNKLLTNGISVGLGTDGPASNNNLDLFEEMKFVSLVHKFANKNTTVLDARTILKMATFDGAKVLGMDKKIGSLEVGKKADIIIIDIENKPHLTPMYNECSHLIYSANGNDVKTVIINGKIVMEHRNIINIDEIEVINKMNLLAEEISKIK